MSRFMDPQAAAAVLVRMPAAEVVGAVVHVEIPGKIHRQHAPDLSRHQHLFDRTVLGRIAIIESDDDLFVVALFGVENSLALLLVDDHWLLGHDVEPTTPRSHDTL